MEPTSVRAILDRTQYDLLATLSGCLLGVLLLSVLRDLFTGDPNFSNWAVVFYSVCAGLICAVWLLRQTNRLPVHLSQLAGTVCYATILLNPTFEVIRGVIVGPMYLAVTLFAGFLAVLSLRYLITAQVLALVLWLAASSQVYSALQILPLLTMNLLAASLGVITLRHRIATLRRIYQLENRVHALESILPMCSGCKKTQDDKGQWHSVESYIEAREEGLLVSHGLCPDCKEQYYGEYLRDRKSG